MDKETSKADRISFLIWLC